MIGIVVVTHGSLAEGLLDAMRMITGEQDQVAAIALREEDEVEGLMERIAAAVEQTDSGEGVLIFVDLFGASPFNASARLALADKHSIQVITGASLPMLVELAVIREGLSLEAAVATARRAGQNGIRTLADTLKKP